MRITALPCRKNPPVHLYFHKSLQNCRRCSGNIGYAFSIWKRKCRLEPGCISMVTQWENAESLVKWVFKAPSSPIHNYNTLRSEMSCVQKGTPSVWCPFRGLDRKRWHGEVFSKSHPSGVIGSQMMTPLKFHTQRRIHNKSLL